MKNLWIAFVVIATLGSIYPFDFSLSALDSETLRVFMRTCCRLPGRGDLVGNILLFLPFGFLGFLALRLARRPVRGIFILCLFGAIFALTLQILQFFLPSRDQSLQDVVWNVAGTLGGALLALAFRRYTSNFGVATANAALAPLVLVAAWLIYLTMPFVPSIDLQSIKDSLKPLVYGELDYVATLADASAWLVVACLLRRVQEGAGLDRFLPAIVAAVLALEVLIVSNAIDRADVVGAGVAVLLWTAWLKDLRRSELVVFVTLVVAIGASALAPFTLRAETAAFHWLPFHGYLGGSTYINAQSAAEKVFLYGSLVYLLVRLSVDGTRSLALATGFVALLEFAQKWFAGHTPEITDPLLVVCAALALYTLEQRASEKGLETAAARRVRGNGSRPLTVVGSDLTGTFPGRWQRQRVNLRREQFELLQKLSREMNVSVSGVARLVIQRFIETSASEPGGMRAALRSLYVAHEHDAYNGHDRWVNQAVNLRSSQLRFLAEIAAELDISVSAAARSVVAHFVQGLTDERAVAGAAGRHGSES